MDIPAQILVSALVALTVFALYQGAIAYAILLERKIVSWIQDRIGPNRVGPMGLLQPLADGIKLFFKEDYIPPRADRWLFLLAPAFVVIPALVGWAVIPWGGYLVLPDISLFGLNIVSGGVPIYVGAADVSIGIVYVLAVGSIGVYGTVLGGWASNNKYSFLGGVRATGQMISYEIPLGVAILIVLLMAGSLRPSVIIGDQVATMWYIVSQPLAALICFTALLAEAHRAPFDLTEAEQELVGGYHTEYSAMKWALFFFAEYGHVFTGAAFFSLLFLGGWHVFPLVPQAPVSGLDGWLFGLIGVLLKISVFAGKVFAIVCFVMIIRWTLPRFRYDQLMNLAWKAMIPLSFVLLVGTAIMIWLGRSEWYWMLAMNAVVGLVVLAIQPFLPRTFEGNHRLAIEGSRFAAPPSAAPAGVSPPPRLATETRAHAAT